jgi:hypothetical protein
MDVKKMAVFGLLALTVLTCAAPAGAWFGPFGGCGFGFGHGSLFPFGLFPFGLFGYPVPVPVPVPVAAPLCAPGPCGIGAPGLGLGGCGWGNNPAIPGPI